MSSSTTTPRSTANRARSTTPRSHTANNTTNRTRSPRFFSGTPRAKKEKRKVWAFIEDKFQAGEEVDGRRDISTPNCRGAKNGTKSVRLCNSDTVYGVPVEDIHDRCDTECDQEDCCSLEKLNTATVLMNLGNRYAKGKIYTYTSTVLLAVNPYKKVDGLYTQQTRDDYSKISSLHAKPPHPYALADKAYRSLRQKNQVIVISGESGAGKTETAKIMMQCLADRSRTGKERAADIQNQLILGANPVLESFGNATTVRNQNSSRFGKHNKLIFNPVGSLVGTEVLSFLLESNRAVAHDDHERSYHVFYELLAGANPELLSKLSLEKNGVYKLLHKPHAPPKTTRDDLTNFRHLTTGLELVGFNKDIQALIFTCLAAFIHLGEVEFVSSGKDDDSILIVGNESFALGAHLLSFDETEFMSAVTMRQYAIKSQGSMQQVTVMRGAREAQDTLNGFMKILYQRLFDYVVKFMNNNLARMNADMMNHYSHIGILDIYGFETLKTNSLEQYCINYANEQLQAFFIDNVILAEQKVYENEGLKWKTFEIQSSEEKLRCLSDAMHSLDNYSIMFATTKKPTEGSVSVDASFTMNLHSSLGSGSVENGYIFEPKRGRSVRNPIAKDAGFVVRHFAGEVTYQTANWLKKNNARLQGSMERVIMSSTHPLVATLADTEGCEYGSAPFTSISKKFEKDLIALVAELDTCKCSFVRCFKPNDDQIANFYDHGKMASQLEQSGTIALVNVMHYGFPHRVTFDEISVKIMNKLPANLQKEDPRILLKALMRLLKIPESDYAIGISRVFFKNGRLEEVTRIMEAEADEAENNQLALPDGSVPRTLAQELLKFLCMTKFRRCVHVVQTVQWLPRYMKKVSLARTRTKVLRTFTLVIKVMRWLKRVRNTIRQRKVDATVRKVQICSHMLVRLNRWKNKCCKERSHINAFEILNNLVDRRQRRAFFDKYHQERSLSRDTNSRLFARLALLSGKLRAYMRRRLLVLHRRAHILRLFQPLIRHTQLIIHARRYFDKLRGRMERKREREERCKLEGELEVLRKLNEEYQATNLSVLESLREKEAELRGRVVDEEAERVRMFEVKEEAMKKQSEAMEKMKEEKEKINEEKDKIKDEKDRMEAEFKIEVEKLRKETEEQKLSSLRYQQLLQEQAELVSSAAANSLSSAAGEAEEKNAAEVEDLKSSHDVALAREKEAEEKYHAEIDALRRENEERSLRLLEEKEVEIARLREETLKKERELQEEKEAELRRLRVELEDRLRREIASKEKTSRVASSAVHGQGGDRTPPTGRNGASSTSKKKSSKAGRKKTNNSSSSTSTTPRLGSDTENTKTKITPRKKKMDEEGKPIIRAKVDTGRMSTGLNNNNNVSSNDRSRSTGIPTPSGGNAKLPARDAAGRNTTPKRIVEYDEEGLRKLIRQKSAENTHLRRRLSNKPPKDRTKASAAQTMEGGMSTDTSVPRRLQKRGGGKNSRGGGDQSPLSDRSKPCSHCSKSSRASKATGGARIYGLNKSNSSMSNHNNSSTNTTPRRRGDVKNKLPQSSAHASSRRQLSRSKTLDPSAPSSNNDAFLGIGPLNLEFDPNRLKMLSRTNSDGPCEGSSTTRSRKKSPRANNTEMTEKERRMNALRSEKAQMEREKREARKEKGHKWNDDLETLQRRAQDAKRHNQILREELHELSKTAAGLESSDEGLEGSPRDSTPREEIKLDRNRSIRRLSVQQNMEVDATLRSMFVPLYQRPALNGPRGVLLRPQRKRKDPGAPKARKVEVQTIETRVPQKRISIERDIQLQQQRQQQLTAAAATASSSGANSLAQRIDPCGSSHEGEGEGEYHHHHHHHSPSSSQKDPRSVTRRGMGEAKTASTRKQTHHTLLKNYQPIPTSPSWNRLRARFEHEDEGNDLSLPSSSSSRSRNENEGGNLEGENLNDVLDLPSDGSSLTRRVTERLQGERRKNKQHRHNISKGPDEGIGRSPRTEEGVLTNWGEHGRTPNRRGTPPIAAEVGTHLQKDTHSGVNPHTVTDKTTSSFLGHDDELKGSGKRQLQDSRSSTHSKSTSHSSKKNHGGAQPSHISNMEDLLRKKQKLLASSNGEEASSSQISSSNVSSSLNLTPRRSVTSKSKYVKDRKNLISTLYPKQTLCSLTKRSYSCGNSSSSSAGSSVHSREDSSPESHCASQPEFPKYSPCASGYSPLSLGPQWIFASPRKNLEDVLSPGFLKSPTSEHGGGLVKINLDEEMIPRSRLKQPQNTYGMKTPSPRPQRRG